MLIEKGKVYKVNTPNGVITFAYAVGIVSHDSDHDWYNWLMYSQKRLFVIQERIWIDYSTDTEWGDYRWINTVCDYCEIPEAEDACNAAYDFENNFGEDIDNISVEFK